MSHRARLQLLAAFLLLGVACPLALSQAAADFHFKFTESPGPYAVGLKVAEQYDRAREFSTASGGTDTAASSGPRPLQILVWYPAEKSTAARTTLGDYAALIKTETSFGKPVESGKSQGFVAQFMHGTEAQTTWAVRDAAMVAGKFPVVVYAPGLNAPATENIELCEYLASHGYVVLASPSMGVTSRTMTVDLAGANAEAKDISFVMDFAGTLPDTDTTSAALIGYSWGGMAALFDAARDKRVRALVSLDGSFRYSADMVQQAGDVHPAEMKIPLLVFSRAEETLETWETQRNGKPPETAPNVLNQWTHADLLHVHLLGVSHIQFSSIYQRSERFAKEGQHFSPADYSLQEGAESYNWMARYTLEFLEAYLRHDANAAAFLRRTPAQNAVPLHLMSTQFRPAASQ